MANFSNTPQPPEPPSLKTMPIGGFSGLLAPEPPAPPDPPQPGDPDTAVPEPVPLPPEPTDPVADAAFDTKIALSQLATELAALTATVSQHDLCIARLNDAVKGLPCPSGMTVEDNTHKDGVRDMDIGECMERGLCTCDVGYALEGATWQPA